MPDIEIKRGYEVLPDNNVRFGVRVINNSDAAISDVEVILDYSESLFELEGNKVQKLGTIPPAVPRTAKFVLKPLGCIHKEEIGATLRYKDYQWNKHVEQMRPKEVHCVCPFLKEKSITRADFLRLSNSGYLEERGINFDGITADKLVDFLGHTCRNRLYKVDEFPIENGKILYLAGDALGEKAYYLLTAVVKEYEGLTQVLFRASSDKSYGLSGFLNEIQDNLRHLVLSANAREIGIIKKEQVVNIIDSVVQRTTISMEEGEPAIKIKDSMVQRTEIKGDEERKRKEEEKLRKEKEEAERLRWQEEEERLRRQREEQERIAREKEEPAYKEPEGTSWKSFFAVALVLGALLIGYWTMALTGDKNVTKNTVMDDNKKVKNGDIIMVDYIGRLINGKVFDTSIESVAKENNLFTSSREYKPLEFTVGKGDVIKGFDEGVVGMKVGESKTLMIPPEKGYGQSDPKLIQVNPVIQVISTRFPRNIEIPLDQFEKTFGSGHKIGDIVKIPQDKIYLTIQNIANNVSLSYNLKAGDQIPSSGAPWKITVVKIDDRDIIVEYSVKKNDIIQFQNVPWKTTVIDVSSESITLRHNAIPDTEISTSFGKARVHFNETSYILDQNHELAEKTLIFDVTLKSIEK